MKVTSIIKFFFKLWRLLLRVKRIIFQLSIFFWYQFYEITSSVSILVSILVLVLISILRNYDKFVIFK